MFSNIIKLTPIVICTCLFFSCKNTENKALQINFSKDSSTILISNIESAALLQLKNNLKTDTMYQKLVDVLETPAEDDSVSMERAYPGKLSMVEDIVVFTPDSPFLRGKSYLVETLIGMKFASLGDVIRSDVGHLSKKQQETLTR